MFKTYRSAPAFLLAAGLALTAPACATQAYPGVRRDSRDFERRAYDEGYRRGFDNGQRDARDRRDFRIDRSYRDRDYRGADGYRRFFSDGYRSGYTEGYERIARNDRRLSPNGSVFGAPGRTTSDDQRVGSPAAQVGYRDGLEAGRDDAKDRESFEPRRSKRYREGDHDYDRRYGSLDQYKQEYRAAFIRGYEEGYRGRR